VPGGIVLQQRDVLAALDRLAAHLPTDVGQHVDRAVRTHLGGAHGLDRRIEGVGEHAAVHPLGYYRLRRGGDGGVGLELQQLGLGLAVVGRGVLVGIGIATVWAT
jgi:hypothetical protein